MHEAQGDGGSGTLKEQSVRSRKGWEGFREKQMVRKQKSQRKNLHLQDKVFNYDLQKPLEKNDQLVPNAP